MSKKNEKNRDETNKEQKTKTYKQNIEYRIRNKELNK